MRTREPSSRAMLQVSIRAGAKPWATDSVPVPFGWQCGLDLPEFDRVCIFAFLAVSFGVPLPVRPRARPAHTHQISCWVPFPTPDQPRLQKLHHPTSGAAERLWDWNYPRGLLTTGPHGCCFFFFFLTCDSLEATSKRNHHNLKHIVAK